MLGLAPHAAALRKVTVRSAEADVLRVRQRFERALASVEWMPPGLPPSAILLVRRLAPAPPEGAMARSSFGERVSMALREQAGHARRPWLHVDAAEAPAVLFTDESELVACLARDWLRGLVAQHWWWRSVLLDASPLAWLRGEVLPRPQTLVPAIALLAVRGEATTFIARLEPADCARAVEAVSRSHSVPQFASHATPVPSPTSSETGNGSGRPLQVAERASRREALRRLVQEIPEVRRASLAASQRRLLALALALERAPTWARTESMAIALDALDDRAVSEFIEAPSPIEGAIVGKEAAVLPVPDAEPVAPVDPRPVQPATEGESTARASDPIASARDPEYEVTPPPASAAPVDPVTTAHERNDDVAQRRPSPAMDELVPAASERTVPLPVVEEAAAIDASLEAKPAPGEAPRSYPVEFLPRITTQFGGLFYLLNVALSLDLYGDFTAPRERGLALSPWDWLAMIGRAWFGEELVDDPLWAALARLAGREPGEEPGRDFEPPSEDWFATHLVEIHERIVLAIGEAGGDDLPAFVCRHAAAVEITAGSVHVHLALGSLPLALRIAGLDRDPGWIPAAGRDVRFHFA